MAHVCRCGAQFTSKLEGQPCAIGIMEKKMETLGPFKGIFRVIWGLYRGNYYNGLYRDYKGL